ncbi:putative PEP-binding protein [Ensifer soli]|uniref:putative PEP-binding protein n=1 Tax=Ciceribacter sp. sgz301302 TaxID=3342379 RepID=UPI0035B7AC97
MGASFNLKGTGVSEGRAAGPAFVPRVHAPGGAGRQGGRRLADAVAAARGALEALAGRCSPDEAALLAVQIELLDDPELRAEADRRIAGGSDAAEAFSATLGALAAGLAKDPGDAFAARADDVADVEGRVLDALAGTAPEAFPPGAIFVGEDMRPSAFLAHDWSRGGGIALFSGSGASHVAMLARSRAVPMVVAAGRFPIENGETLLIDGGSGDLVIGGAPEGREPRPPGPAAMRAEDDGRVALPDGRVLTLLATINSEDELGGLDPSAVAGIGVVRSEFFVPPAARFDEAAQARLYRRLMLRAKGKPVTVRLFDFGGDKDIPAGSGDDSPDLRGVRLLLARPDLARAQIRALLAAAPAGDLRILLPMVTVPGEVAAIAAILADEAAAVGVAVPPLGIMVEVPAAALTLDAFPQAAFFSLGTNDLLHALAAARRSDAATAALVAATRPALLRLVAHVVAGAGGRPVCICGDLAGEPGMLPALVAAGLSQFSMAPARMAAFRAAAAGLPRTDGEAGGDGA